VKTGLIFEAILKFGAVARFSAAPAVPRELTMNQSNFTGSSRHPLAV
jgi:hypothetical protein